MNNQKLIISPVHILFLGIVAVSTASVFIRFAQEDTSSLMISAFRMAFAFIIIFPLTIKLVLQQIHQIVKKEWLLLFLSGTFLAFHFFSWITSLEISSVASSAVLVTTTPIWVSLVSPIFLREKVKLQTWIGLLIALVGVVTIAISNTTGGFSSKNESTNDLAYLPILGNLLALIGSWLAAGYLIVGRILRKRLFLQTYTFFVYGFAALILFALLFVFFDELRFPDFRVFQWFFLLGLIPQVIGHSCFNWALGELPAVYVSIAILGEPIGASVLAWVFLNEIPTGLEIIGSAFIFCGILIASMKRKLLS